MDRSRASREVAVNDGAGKELAGASALASTWTITEANAESYLRAMNWVESDEAVKIQRLSGGVSNEVFRVCRSTDRGEDFVIKQARERLRVPELWTCPVERIWRERDVLRACQRLLSQRCDQPESLATQTPLLLAEDADNFVIAISAAAWEQTSWKDQLLAGETRGDVAEACGWLLGALHAEGWGDDELRNSLADRGFFVSLRIEPYYHHVAEKFPELRAALQTLEESLAAHPRTLVHGDFSPKNLLVGPRAILLIDFEVGHYGDPAFDIGFFLSHLTLKAFRAPTHRTLDYLELIERFWSSYQATLAPAIGPPEWEMLERRGLRNLAGCGLARLDGKSTIDYLDATQSDAARAVFREWLCGREASQPMEAIRRALSPA